MTTWNLAAVERAFAQAATDPAHWSLALQRLTESTASYGAIFFPITGGLDFETPRTKTMDDSFDAYFRQGWYQRDERYKGAATLMAKGVVDDLDILTAEAIARHPYYQDFLASFRLKWFAGLKVAVGHEVWCISLQRRSDQDPFSPLEKQRLACLAQSVSCSAGLAQALGSAALEGALGAFEATSKAVALVNAYGQVVRMNAAAERLLRGEVTSNARS
jgi:hypothetical protein